ncbi:methionine ABC transporter permease [Alkalibacterium olivapovliticus]|uniref:D-methionine transport system permease protein n=1 Tax=Alkalibacterium olivapovliticus TaxID=99907 RepID=A0A2T0W5B8_9LACT|nr:methionine ABC transporter permease [Alkalibacterium olivapovliticus]MCC5895367.1 ABC transporter permease [Alkalibacterium sp.]PRY80976.1 D-methionine transport system permease protein [Alkalibacterium olivapovliticus]
MTESISLYIERVIEFSPRLIESLWETGIMLFFAMIAAILLGIPVGTLLYLTADTRPMANRFLNRLLNILVNIIRSFPFLLLVVAMQPFIRQVYGRATGDPIAASFPMVVIAIALYARFVEQSLMEVPRGITETAQSMGATNWQLVWKFLYVEARSSLVIGFTTAVISFVSYSTIMGVVGGGGIGDFAIRYGYQRYETDIMYTAIVLIIILVEIFQWLGLKLAKRIDKR